MEGYALEPNISLFNVNGHLFRQHKQHARGSSEEGVESEVKGREGSEVPVDVVDPAMYPIVEKQGAFSLEVPFPGELFGRLIGKQGKTLKRIEQQSGAKVVIPRGESGQSVTVSAKSKNSVAVATHEIESLLSEFRSSAPFTHFLSLPLTTDANVLAKLREFLGAVESMNAPGFDKTIVLNEKHFHLTLIMLKLLTTEEINRARKVLESMSAAIYDCLGTRTLLLTLKGVDVMCDDVDGPEKARSLFARIVEEDDRLRKMISELFRGFKEAGLVASDHEEYIKLHATILNTRFRKTANPYAPKVLLDARSIVQKFGTFEFGKMRVESLHLSQRFKYDASGYYHCVKQLSLP